MIVWQADDGVRARRFFATGEPAGDELVVSEPEMDAGNNPGNTDSAQSIAADAAGNFMVAFNASRPTDTHSPVFARRFSVDFEVGPLFLTYDPNQPTLLDFQQAINPEIAADGNGSFVVVWEGYDYNLGGPNPSGYGGSGEGVFGRRLVPSGQTTGPVFLANTSTEGYQGDFGSLDVAAGPDGTFTVAWASEDYDDYYTYVETGSTTVQRFSKSGKKLGGEVHVSTDFDDFSSREQIASASDGTTMVVWEDDGIAARLLAPDGVPLGSDIEVTSGSNPSVAASEASFGFAYSKGGDLIGRIFDLSGTPATDEFVIGDGWDQDIALDAAGNVIVTWEFGPDILVRRFQIVAPVEKSIPVFGNTLLVANKVPDDKEKNKGIWKAKDPAIVVPLRGSLGDPRCNADPAGTVKAGVRFLSTTSGQDTGLLPLPCQNWTATGGQKVGSVPKRGYKYADAKLLDGPCNSVKIVGTKTISVSCKGKGDTNDFLYDLVPGTNEGAITAVLEVRGQRFCSEVPATPGTDGSDGKKFKGKNAPAPGGCPAALLPTPTPIPTPSPTPSP